MREEKCAQNVLLVIYSIPESLLKFGFPVVISPYLINKSIRSEPIQNKIIQKEKLHQSRKKNWLSHNNFSSLILRSKKTIYKLIKLILFMLMALKLINKFPSKYLICD